jgi:hypothetical protein
MPLEYWVWLLVTIIRILVPFSIVRWPLAGAIFCIIADTYDHTVFRTTGFGPFGSEHYQQWDKLLDTWYLLMLFAVSLQWTNALARRTCAILFLWRLTGVIILERTGWRPVLVFAPNMIENFYLFWTMSMKWFPFRLTPKRLVLALLALGLPKLYQEASMHWLAPDQPLSTPLVKLFNHFSR